MKGLPYNSEFFANSSGFNFQDSEFTGVGRDMYVVINYAPNGIQFLDAGDRQGATGALDFVLTFFLVSLSLRRGYPRAEFCLDK